MITTFELITRFMRYVENTEILADACDILKAYEGKNLPVPIRKTYLAFSGESNKVTYFNDENGIKMEKNDIIIKINCYVPLSKTPTMAHLDSEAVALYLSVDNEEVTGFEVGETEYDSDVNAYKITSRIFYSLTQAVNY